MKKIVLLIDALNFSPTTFGFAAGIAKLSGASITGLFIYDTTVVAAVPEVKLMAGQAYVEEIVISEDERQKVYANIETNRQLFMDSCAKEGVTGVTQLEHGIAVDLILHESRFADILIAAPSLTFSGDERTPSRYVKDILAGAECPVLLAPEHNNPIEEVVIAYNNSQSSMFAIKHFCYQFPALLKAHVTVLNISETGTNDLSEEDEAAFSNWLKLYCPKFDFVTLVGNASDVLLNYFMWNDNNNKLLVTGGYGRSAVSMFFNPSAADMVLKTVDIPVYMAHG